ncbi:MAG: ATP-binding protein [Sciscionella sp.]
MTRPRGSVTAPASVAGSRARVLSFHWAEDELPDSMPARLAKVGSVCAAAHAILTEWELVASDAANVRRILFEVLCNAIQHGTPPIHIVVDQGFTGAMNIAVGDAGAGTPRLPRSTPQQDPHRLRGLTAVDALAQGWDVQELAGGGKTVTAVFVPQPQLSTPARSTPQATRRMEPKPPRRAQRGGQAGEGD